MYFAINSSIGLMLNSAVFLTKEKTITTFPGDGELISCSDKIKFSAFSIDQSLSIAKERINYMIMYRVIVILFEESNMLDSYSTV
jgi:hypothetical protein